MNKNDLEYLIENLANLCGIPARLYENNTLLKTYFTISLKKDPIILYEKEILNHNENIGYFTTKDFFYYAFLKSNEYKIILGPFRLLKPTNSILFKLALELELNKDDYKEFVYSMNNIVNMPLESVLQSLLMFNYILNNEKISLADVLLDKEKDKELDKEIQIEVSNKQIEEYNTNYENNSLNIEQELISIVENGDVAKLKAWINNAHATKAGKLSSDVLRQAKNTFIVATTIFSRAAIKGNMSIIDALSLSDLYIQKAELMQNVNDILSLQIRMLFDFTEHVSKIKGNNESSLFLVKLNKYIIEHLSEAIKAEDICASLFVSKSTLFSKVKRETEMTVSNYILKMKINESKNLLKYSDKSIASISVYLGFSSQSHFNNTFKSFMKMTPLAYRKLKNIN